MVKYVSNVTASHRSQNTIFGKCLFLWGKCLFIKYVRLFLISVLLCQPKRTSYLNKLAVKFGCRRWFEISNCLHKVLMYYSFKQLKSNQVTYPQMHLP